MKYDRLLSITVRSAYIWAAFASLAGVVLFIAFGSRGDPLGQGLSLGGQAVFSAGVVAITFGWISSEENEVRIERIVERNLQAALRPIVIRSLEGCLRDRIWNCHLSQPQAGDPLPDYLYQTMSISYTVQKCPGYLGFAGIAGASPDWTSYLGDEYQFRWEFDAGLDPAAQNVFDVKALHVDDTQLTGTRYQRSDEICEYRFKVPKAKQGQTVRISFIVATRLFWGKSPRIQVKTKVFKDIDGAEFRLALGSGIKATRMTSGTDGVASLMGNAPRFIRESLTDSSGSPVSHFLRLLDPVQRDSQISFEVEISD